MAVVTPKSARARSAFRPLCRMSTMGMIGLASDRPVSTGGAAMNRHDERTHQDRF